MPSTPQFFGHVYFQIRLRNNVQGNTHLPVCSILKKHVVALNSEQEAPEVSLSIDGLPRFQLGLTARESFEVGALVQTSFESRRRYFQRIGRVNEVFHVENCPEVDADFRAILVGHTLRLVNEYTNNRLVLWAGNFGVNQLEAMIDCHSFS